MDLQRKIARQLACKVVTAMVNGQSGAPMLCTSFGNISWRHPDHQAQVPGAAPCSSLSRLSMSRSVSFHCREKIAHHRGAFIPLVAAHIQRFVLHQRLVGKTFHAISVRYVRLSDKNWGFFSLVLRGLTDRDEMSHRCHASILQTPRSRQPHHEVRLTLVSESHQDITQIRGQGTGSWHTRERGLPREYTVSLSDLFMAE